MMKLTRIYVPYGMISSAERGSFHLDSGHLYTFWKNDDYSFEGNPLRRVFSTWDMAMFPGRKERAKVRALAQFLVASYSVTGIKNKAVVASFTGRKKITWMELEEIWISLNNPSGLIKVGHFLWHGDFIGSLNF